MGIDLDELSFAGGQYLALGIADLGGAVVLAAAHPLLPAFRHQRLVQRHRLEVGHIHGAGETDNVVQLVQLAHSLIEDGSDDAPMRVLGRSDELALEAELTDKALTLFVEDEPQSKSDFVFGAAAETFIAELTFLDMMTRDCLVPWHVTKMKQRRWKMQEERLTAKRYAGYSDCPNRS